METELDYSPLFGLLYNTAVEYMDKVVARKRSVRFAGVISGCEMLVFAYPHYAQAKILVPNYVSRIIEDVVATAVRVRNSIGYGTYFVIAMATCPRLPTITYAKLPVDVGKSRGFLIVDGEVSPVDVDTVATALTNAFRTFTSEILLGFADYYRGLHHAVLIRAFYRYSPKFFLTMVEEPPRAIPWSKTNLLAIGVFALVTAFTAMARPGDTTAVVPFVFLLIAVAYPWLKPIIEPLIDRIINRRKRVVAQ